MSEGPTDTDQPPPIIYSPAAALPTSPPSLADLALQQSPPDNQSPNSKFALRFSEIQNIATHVQPPKIPYQRTHDPSKTLKRTDPFQFGTRYLQDTDEVLSYNAWDNVDPSTDTLYTSYSTAQYALQRTNGVSDYDRKRFNAEPAKWWNKFYSHNSSNFFKDRKWLRQEFPILAECTRKREPDEKGKNVILEIGAGAGNTAFPILAVNENPEFVIYACDYSKKAVELIRANEAYDGKHIRAEVWDVASTTETLPPGVDPESVDVVLMVFIFSALNPTEWAQAVRNVWRALKPGGEVCFRDYGRGDLAQVRFKKGRWLEENFYVRGDGTRVYFFDEEELRGIWDGSSWLRDVVNGENGGKTLTASNEREDGNGKTESRPVSATEDRSSVPAFEIVSLGVDRRLLVNRQKQLKMYRCWMQGRFRKPETPPHAAEGALFNVALDTRIDT